MTDLIRIESKAAEQLRTLSSKHGYSMSYIATRLINRLFDGEFSGSIHDIVRKEARPEPTNFAWKVASEMYMHLREEWLDRGRDSGEIGAAMACSNLFEDILTKLENEDADISPDS